MIRLPRAWALGPRRTNDPRLPLPRVAPPFRATALPRRQIATKPDVQHPTAQAAPRSPKTIPGPSWLWLEPIYEPFRAYGRVQQRRPYMTQFVSALVIYFIGDIVAQSLGKPPVKSEEDVRPDVGDGGTAEEEEEEVGWVQEWIEHRDWQRTGRALLIGGAAAVPGYKWFLWLSNSFNYSSKVLSLATKVSVSQVLFTPIFNSYFFGMQYILTTSLSDLSFLDLVERLQHTVPVSWVNSCKIWPAVTAFSFSFIPIQYRSIFGGVIAIGWQTYLSLLNQRAAAEEVVAHELEHQSHHQDAASDRERQRAEERTEGKCPL